MRRIILKITEAIACRIGGTISYLMVTLLYAVGGRKSVINYYEFIDELLRVK